MRKGCGIPIAAACAYFNPCHYMSRLNNYRLFRTNIDETEIRLLTIELAIGDDPFELSGFSNIIQVRSRDVMWQKERLLNIGISNLLSEGFEYIAWLDADLIFQNSDWPNATIQALEESRICQLFGQIQMDARQRTDVKIIDSIAKEHSNQLPLRGVPGGAWAGRRSVFENCLLYDAAIIGGGDSLIFFACFSNANWENWMQLAARHHIVPPLSSAHRQHYFDWAIHWGEAIQGDIGVIDHECRALFHGVPAQRYYGSRHNILISNDYSPAMDIALSLENCWIWSSDKPKFHAEIRDYFFSRREDE